MAKPSIFSRDYEKIMRKRKKRRNIIVLLGVLTLSVSIIIIKYDMQKISAAFKDIAFSKELGLSSFRTENINLSIDDYILTLKVLRNNDDLEIVDIKCDKHLISTDINKDRLVSSLDGLFPCTPLGVMELLDRYNISVCSKNVVILGRSELVGKPLSTMIRNKGGNVIVCHSKTEDISIYTRNADIIISAVGKVKLLTGDMVSDGAIVIDVGINICENGICGDVDFESVKDKCSYITPVPGGVGPMTVAMLAKNILKAYKMQK